MGTSGQAICVYADEGDRTLDWVRYDARGAWTVERDVRVDAKGTTASVRIESLHYRDSVFVMVSGERGRLLVVPYDHEGWSAEDLEPVETELSSTTTVPFTLDIKGE